MSLQQILEAKHFIEAKNLLLGIRKLEFKFSECLKERENWGSPGHLVEPQYAVDPWCLLFDILPFYRLAPYYWDRSKALMSSAYLWVITPLSQCVASAIILTISIAIRRSPAYLHLRKCSSFFTTWPGWKSFKFLNSVSLRIVNSTWLSFLFYEFEICS